MCRSSLVRKISFTGSTTTGQEIVRLAGIKRLSLELGSACPVVILPDADLETAASAVAVGGYANAGQVCISVQRVLVAENVEAEFLDALVPKVIAIRTGDPSDAATTMGTLINEDEAKRVERAVQTAIQNGSRLLCGGERRGAAFAPTVMANVDPQSPLSQQELFGPAVAVTAVSGVDDAIRVVNDSQYGLSAGIFTKSISSAVRFARDVDAGNLHINWTPLWRADLMPYGGLKMSGFGKEGVRRAVAEMTEEKTVIFHGSE
jgi:glyceraldehyde-3-phosphate dehydrogenase (NADP+)